MELKWIVIIVILVAGIGAAVYFAMTYSSTSKVDAASPNEVSNNVDATASQNSASNTDVTGNGNINVNTSNNNSISSSVTSIVNA
jgi:flagellar basal body-associated protein FliL